MARKRAPARVTADGLDRKLDALFADRGAAPSRRTGELGALAGIAAELRDLPRAEFRSTLAREFRTPITARDLPAELCTLGPREDRFLGSLERASVLLCSFSGRTPWERHPDGDELISVLEGEGEITVLTDDGPVTSQLHAGGIFICPKGLWHRTHARTPMKALYVTPLSGGEHSFADDPRRSAP